LGKYYHPHLHPLEVLTLLHWEQTREGEAVEWMVELAVSLQTELVDEE
jgi:hypothetical protein